MIGPDTATAVIFIFLAVFGVILPVLDVKLKDFISLRWSVIVVIMAMMLGVTINFHEMAEGTRNLILKGGLIISGAYVGLRTIEKAIILGWKGKIIARKGDASLELSGRGPAPENPENGGHDEESR